MSARKSVALIKSLLYSNPLFLHDFCKTGHRSFKNCFRRFLQVILVFIFTVPTHAMA